jgi:hypothetical protein
MLHKSRPLFRPAQEGVSQGSLRPGRLKLDNKSEFMQNNVRVSDPIFEAMSREAQRTGVDLNGLFDEAAKQLLAHREVDALAAVGERHARRLGLKPSDSVRLVREDRKRQRGL